MTIRPILIHPDPRLKKTAEPVVRVDDELRALIADMFDTMYAAPGIGLAAPQVGVLARVIVMDCATRDARDSGEDAALTEPQPDPIAMINPEIVAASAELRTCQEGCLSIPEEFEDVTRPAEVTVRWLDPGGATLERRFGGIRATCLQHEIDHLNGKLFLDYLGPVKRSMITGRMKKLKRERAREAAEKKPRPAANEAASK